MFLFITLLLSHSHNCRFDGRLEYLKVYSWNNEELVEAIGSINMEYQNAILKHLEPMDMAIANLNFIQSAIEIMQNCSHVNSTLCKPTNKEIVTDNYIWILYFAPFVLIIMCVCIFYREKHKIELL